MHCWNLCVHFFVCDCDNRVTQENCPSAHNFRKAREPKSRCPSLLHSARNSLPNTFCFLYCLRYCHALHHKALRSSRSSSIHPKGTSWKKQRRRRRRQQQQKKLRRRRQHPCMAGRFRHRYGQLKPTLQPEELNTTMSKSRTKTKSVPHNFPNFFTHTIRLSKTVFLHTTIRPPVRIGRHL